MLTANGLLDSFAAELSNRVVEAHGDTDAGDWREDPVSFTDFVQSEKHLGLPPLYEIQYDDAIALLGDDPKMTFGGPEQPDRSYELQRKYQQAVLLWGKGSGKDYLSSIIVAYLIYILLCLRDPHRYFGIAPGENIDVVNVAYNADQARRVFFFKFKARLDRWVWLQDSFNIVEGGRRKGTWLPGRPTVTINDSDVEFPRDIRAVSRHAQNESYEGLNIIAWVMDEASAFLSQLKRENAHNIHHTLRSSARTRFKLRWLGFILSFPRHKDDFTMTELAKAQKAGEKSGVYASGPHKCWVVNRMYDGEEKVKAPDGTLVPISLVADYEDDMDDAKAKYECDPPAAVEALIKHPERLRDAVQHGRPSLIDWRPVEVKRTVTNGKGEAIERTFAAVEILKWGKLPKNARLFWHGDPAYSSDAFALAIGHGVPATVMRTVRAGEVIEQAGLDRRGLDPDDFIEWEFDVQKTIIDALIVWRPDPRRKIAVDLLNVKEVLLELNTRKVTGYRIAGGTFDQFESAETVQALQAKRLPVENEQWGNPLQVRIYKGARRSFYNDLVSLPDTPTITSMDPKEPGFIYEMERVELIEDRKIDHPDDGSKDLADAVVRVIEHVSEDTTRRRVAWGTAHGNVSAYEGKGTHARSTEPTVNPDRTPSPASPAARAREAAWAKERPAGPLKVDAPAPAARQVTPEEAAAIEARSEHRKGQRAERGDKDRSVAFSSVTSR